MAADLKEICRLCLANKNHANKIFFRITGDQRQKFESITELQLLLTTSLPTKICSECSDQLENFFFYKNQLIRKQNELLQYLKISSQQQLEEHSLHPDSVEEDEAECLEELYEDSADFDENEGGCDSGSEMEELECSSDEEFEAEERKETVTRSEEIEYSFQQPKLVLTSNFLKAREAIKQNTSKDSSVPLTYLPATLITNTEEKSVFICSQCNIEFSSENEAKLHMADHRFGAGGQACGFCQITFKTRHNYDKHLDSVHNNTKYVCQVCGKVFDSRIQHRSHLRNHDQTLKHSCSFDGCSKAFRVKHHLKNHMRVHTKDSPFECSYEGCSARFRQKHALTIHLRKHNGDYVACDLCKSPFVTQFQLNKHSKTCNGTYKPLVTRNPRSQTARKESLDFSCSIDNCLKSYKSKTLLELHMTQSHLEDSALCVVCCQVFESDLALKSHHCVSSQTTCLICRGCFKDEENLSIHMQEYHETDEL